MSGRDYQSDVPHFSPSPAGETLKLRKSDTDSGSCPQSFDALFYVGFFFCVELLPAPGFWLRKKDVLSEEGSDDCHRSLCGMHRLRLQNPWLEGSENWGLQAAS